MEQNRDDDKVDVHFHEKEAICLIRYPRPGGGARIARGRLPGGAARRTPVSTAALPPALPARFLGVVYVPFGLFYLYSILTITINRFRVFPPNFISNLKLAFA
jgi:hypothetical protein